VTAPRWVPLSDTLSVAGQPSPADDLPYIAQAGFNLSGLVPRANASDPNA
jgi:protein tyrosine phosphatase (PTP) superfamily phosphohydrolase (DUF442 family)